MMTFNEVTNGFDGIRNDMTGGEVKAVRAILEREQPRAASLWECIPDWAQADVIAACFALYPVWEEETCVSVTWSADGRRKLAKDRSRAAQSHLRP